MSKAILFYLYLSFLAALSSCGNNKVRETLAPVDSTDEIYDNESYAIDTVKNRHLKYDNP